MRHLDVTVDDIAPNLRFVGVTNFRAVTITLDVKEAADFEDWCAIHRLEPKSFRVGPSTTVQYVLNGLTEQLVLMIKLTWARSNITSSRRTLG